MEKKKSFFSRKLVWIALTALIAFGLVRVYYRLTDDFRLANMTYEIPHQKDWEIAELAQSEQEQLSAILNQKFYYLGKGAQSYVFSSQDGKYVLKFFKFKHLKPSFFLSLLPPVTPFAQFRQKEEIRKERKLKSVFDGYHLAYAKHKEETGLVFLHLNKTTNLHKTVTVVDKIGLSHQIDLDPVVFLIQDKGETLRTVMSNLLKQGNVPLAKERIRQIFDLYYSEYKKGIYDRDHGVMHNTGFIGNKPIHLDVGKFSADETMKNSKTFKADLELIHKKIDRWVSAHYPEYRDEIVKDMHQKFLEVTGE